MNSLEHLQIYLDELSENKIFTVGRVGSSEIIASNSFDGGQEISRGIISMLQNNAGVYGNSIEDFCKEYLITI